MTALFENWNRYYAPESGRYLSPDPMLLRPDFQLASARGARSVASYAYANGNPVAFVDPTGRYALHGRCDNYDRALAVARKFAGCDAGGKADKTCKCQKKLASCGAGACDICSILTPGTLPDLFPVDQLKDENGVAIWGATYSDRAKRLVGRVDIEQYLCSDDANIPLLADTLLHEAAHVCSTWNRGRVVDDPSSDCDAKGITRECGFR